MSKKSPHPYDVHRLVEQQPQATKCATMSLAEMKYPRGVNDGELSAVLGPRLFMVAQVLWAAAGDDIGDLCPWHDDQRRRDFLTGLANTLEDVLEVLEQSHARACAEEAGTTATDGDGGTR